MRTIYAVPVASSDVQMAGVTLGKWLRRGYGTAALIDGDTPVPANAEIVLRVDEYHGWAWAVNKLCAALPDVEFLITGGADVLPDGDHDPNDIADECLARFGTMGVMQPAGDAYGAIADKSAAVSPWIGRDFRRKAYGGRGPCCDLYQHFYADAELMHVADKLGCMWWREDLTQYHDHYARRGNPRPPHLQVLVDGVMEQDALFKKRQAEGWPGHGLAS